MTTKKQIKGNMEAVVGLLEESKKQTTETLPAFLESLLNDYERDEDFEIFATSVGGLTTMFLMASKFGLSQNQALHVAWDMFRRWLNMGNRPLVLIDYASLLYTQTDGTNYNEITPDVHLWLKNEATRLINAYENGDFADNPPSEENVERWKKIRDGWLPEPMTGGILAE